MKFEVGKQFINPFGYHLSSSILPQSAGNVIDRCTPHLSRTHKGSRSSGNSKMPLTGNVQKLVEGIYKTAYSVPTRPQPITRTDEFMHGTDH